MRKKRLMVLIMLVLIMSSMVTVAFASGTATGAVMWNANRTLSIHGSVKYENHKITVQAEILGPDKDMVRSNSDGIYCEYGYCNSVGTKIGSTTRYYLYMNHQLTQRTIAKNSNASYGYLYLHLDATHTYTVYDMED